MKSSIVGELTALEHDENYFESAPYPIPYFDNEPIKIGFVDAIDKQYLAKADEALKQFLRLNSSDKIADTAVVKQYYDDVQQWETMEPLNISASEQIWNYVHPSEIVIDWNEKGEVYVVVSAECDWEEEHGLQLVFKAGVRLTRAGGHDGHYED